MEFKGISWMVLLTASYYVSARLRKIGALGKTDKVHYRSLETLVGPFLGFGQGRAGKAGASQNQNGVLLFWLSVSTRRRDGNLNL